MKLLGILLSLSVLASSTWAISSYLNENDQSRLKEVLLAGLSNEDISILDHAVRGLALINAQIPNKDKLCQKLSSKLTGELKADALFHIGKAGSALGCSIKAPAGTKEKLESSLDGKSSVSELFFASGALSSLGLGLDSAKTLKALNAALKKDDGIASLGQAFHIAASLQGDVSSVFSRIEDAVVQADQVDGKMLQFEGGLSVTALVVSGAYQLAKTAGKAPAITKDQANKFAEYFVSRKSVQSVKGVHGLLEVATILADNTFHLPVAITLASRAAVSKSEPRFQVRVTDILGRKLKASVNVVADSATRTLDDAVVLSQKQLTSKDAGVFELDLMSSNPGKGVYKVALSASSANEPRLAGNTGALVEIKVLTKIAIEEAELGTADSDQSTAPKLRRVAYPAKHDGALEADSHQKLILKFQLREQGSGGAKEQLVTVHQAFVRLTHRETQQEIFFVAEPDVNDVYKFDLDLAAKAKDFLYLSGAYSMDLIIGDAVIENPTVWQVADLKLTFTAQPTALPKSAGSAEMYRAKPEIKHMFREPEKRPPAIVSNLFTLLVILPFVIFLGIALKLGLSFSSATFSMSALGFHVSMGAIFGLFFCFWTTLNMFQTLKWLAILALPAFITGNFMLAGIASSRKPPPAAAAK